MAVDTVDDVTVVAVSKPAGVEANARLTGATGALLFLLFFFEGLTILAGVEGYISAHVFIGVLIVPLVLLKCASTGYRFIRYYRGDPAYVRKGPPQVVLRLLGPLVVLSTVAVIGTGVWLLVAPDTSAAELGHQVSFVLWFIVIAVHVLGHLRETPRLAAADWRKPAAGLRRRSARIGALVAALVMGLVLGAWSLTWIRPGLFR